MWTSLAPSDITYARGGAYNANVGFEMGTQFWQTWNLTLSGVTTGGQIGPRFVRATSAGVDGVLFMTTRLTGSTQSTWPLGAREAIRQSAGSSTNSAQVLLWRRQVNHSSNLNGCAYPLSGYNPNVVDSVGPWVLDDLSVALTANSSWRSVATPLTAAPASRTYDFQVQVRPQTVGVSIDVDNVRTRT
jgi:hypothetical protein